MQTLAQVFADAQEKERRRWGIYEIADPPDPHADAVYGVQDRNTRRAGQVESIVDGTRAACERFIAQRCNDAGFRAVRQRLCENQVFAPTPDEAGAYMLLEQLIADGGDK